MTTAELIKALQEADPSGRRTVCIDAVGFPGGVGNSWAGLPRPVSAHHGIDWHNSMVLLYLDKSVRRNEKAKPPKNKTKPVQIKAITGKQFVEKARELGITTIVPLFDKRKK